MSGVFVEQVFDQTGRFLARIRANWRELTGLMCLKSIQPLQQALHALYRVSDSPDLHFFFTSEFEQLTFERNLFSKSVKIAAVKTAAKAFEGLFWVCSEVYTGTKTSYMNSPHPILPIPCFSDPLSAQSDVFSKDVQTQWHTTPQPLGTCSMPAQDQEQIYKPPAALFSDSSSSTPVTQCPTSLLTS